MMYTQNQMKKNDKNTGEYDESGGHDDGDDNEYPEEGETVVSNLLHDISIDERTVEYHNIEHQQTSDDKSVSEHHNDTTTGIPHIPNTV